VEILTDKIIELLRSRGDHREAALADKELPDAVDLDRDAGLLTNSASIRPNWLRRGAVDPRIEHSPKEERLGQFSDGNEALADTKRQGQFSDVDPDDR
jgi:hypothetical protein